MNAAIQDCIEEKQSDIVYDITKKQFQDPTLSWDENKLQDRNAFKTRYKLLDKLTSGGQGSIYNTKMVYINESSTIIIKYVVTKSYKIKNKRDKFKALQEWNLIHQLQLLCYGEIFFDDIKNEIYIPMDPMDIVLPNAMEIQKNDTNYDIYNLCIGNIDNIKYRTGNMKNIQYFILEISGYLQKLHDRSYVHLDIKPNNIMMRNHSGEGNVHGNNGWKLIDYGLMKFIPKTCDEYILLHRFSGTTNWEAPECTKTASKKKPNVVSCKTDIFSFGLVILYIINGYNVFRYEEHKSGKRKSKSIKSYVYLNKYKESQFNQVINEYLFSLFRENKINNHLYAILLGMLKYKQSERLSALQIIKHSWFLEHVYFRDRTQRYYLRRNDDRYISPELEKKKYTNLTSIIKS